MDRADRRRHKLGSGRGWMKVQWQVTGAKGFVVIRRRWVVERTFAWIMKCRCLARDYEQLTRVAEALITVAAIATLVRRWP